MPSKPGNIETKRQQERCFKYLTQTSTVTKIAMDQKQTLGKTRLELLKKIMIPMKYELGP